MDADNDKKITHDEMHRWFTEVRGSKEGIPPGCSSKRTRTRTAPSRGKSLAGLRVALRLTRRLRRSCSSLIV